MHQRIECSCGALLSQCRCIGPKKTVVRPHPACELYTDARRIGQAHSESAREGAEVMDILRQAGQAVADG
jgi:hypothetical protein